MRKPTPVCSLTLEAYIRLLADPHGYLLLTKVERFRLHTVACSRELFQAVQLGAGKGSFQEGSQVGVVASTTGGRSRGFGRMWNLSCFRWRVQCIGI